MLYLPGRTLLSAGAPSKALLTGAAALIMSSVVQLCAMWIIVRFFFNDSFESINDVYDVIIVWAIFYFIKERLGTTNYCIKSW